MLEKIHGALVEWDARASLTTRPLGEFRKFRRSLSRATSIKLSDALGAERVKRNDAFAEEFYSTFRAIGFDQFSLLLEKLRRIDEDQFLRFSATAPQVGQRIRKFRERCRMPRVELQRRSGVPLTSLEYYERGVRKPGVLVLEKIAAALGVTIDCFLEEGTLVESNAAKVLLPLAGGLGWRRWRALLDLMLARQVAQRRTGIGEARANTLLTLSDKAFSFNSKNHSHLSTGAPSPPHPGGNADVSQNKWVARKAICKTMKTKVGQNRRLRRHTGLRRKGGRKRGHCQ